MTNELHALRGLAEAAREITNMRDSRDWGASKSWEAWRKMHEYVRALDALLADPAVNPPGKTVEVRAIVVQSVAGDLSVMGYKPAGFTEWNHSHHAEWKPLAIITAHVPLPVIPVLPATVETGE